MYLVVDVDGVLADARARSERYLTGKRDWDAFFAAAKDDPEIPEMIDVVNTLRQGLDLTTVLLTGRPERTRELTERWLYSVGVEWDVLAMRGDRDRRPATTTKPETLRALGITPRQTFLVIDDDPRVIGVLRVKGFTTALVGVAPSQ